MLASTLFSFSCRHSRLHEQELVAPASDTPLAHVPDTKISAQHVTARCVYVGVSACLRACVCYSVRVQLEPNAVCLINRSRGTST
jgi:hypothetical protein